MASKALHQLINETAWPELDYLIVDMPPGTGDIQLTMAQQVPLSGAVVVTTPQDLALADAIKGIAMFNKVNIPVLGLVENMSYHLCSQCGHKEAIFSEQGGDKLSEKYNLPLLGKLPLNIDIRQHADSGKPLQVSNPEHALSEAYRQLARQTAKYCYLKSVQIA
jgi:ATP-binding protein involved in chromosome partitioning